MLPRRPDRPRFLSAFSGISPHFRPRRHLMTAPDYRAEMTVRFTIWEQITGAKASPSRPDWACSALADIRDQGFSPGRMSILVSMGK